MAFYSLYAASEYPLLFSAVFDFDNNYDKFTKMVMGLMFGSN